MQNTSEGTGRDTHQSSSAATSPIDEPQLIGGNVTCSPITLSTLSSSLSHPLYRSEKDGEKDVDGRMPAMPRPPSSISGGVVIVAAVAPPTPHNESIHRPQIHRRKTYGCNGNSPPSSNPLLSLVHLDQPVQVPIPPSLERRLSANNTNESTISRHKTTTGTRLVSTPSLPWYDYDEFGTAKGNIVGGLGIYSRQTMEKEEYVARYASEQGSRRPLSDQAKQSSQVSRRSIVPIHVKHPSPSSYSLSPVSPVSPLHSYNHRPRTPPRYDYTPTRDM